MTPSTLEPRNREPVRQGKRNWRWPAVGVILAGGLIGAGFEFRHAGLSGLANLTQVASAVPVAVFGLIGWAKKGKPLEEPHDIDKVRGEQVPASPRGRPDGSPLWSPKYLVAGAVMVIALALALWPLASDLGIHKRSSLPPATAVPPAPPRDSVLLSSLPNRPESGTFSPDGKLLAVGTVNGEIREWDVSAHTLTDSMTDPGSRGVNALAFSFGDALLAAADANGYVSLWAGHDLKQTLADPSGSNVLSVAFSFDKQFLAIGDAAGNVYVCRLTGETCGKFGPKETDHPNSKGVNSLAFNPASNVLAAGDGNGNVYLWVHTLGKVIPDPSGAPIRSVTFTANNDFVVAGDASGEVYQWGYTSNGKQVTATASPVAFPADPDSKGVELVTADPLTGVIAASDANGHVYQWQRNVLVQPSLAVPSGDRVLSVSFSGASESLVIADASDHVYLYPKSLPDIAREAREAREKANAGLAAPSPAVRIIEQRFESGGIIFIVGRADPAQRITRAELAGRLGADTSDLPRREHRRQRAGRGLSHPSPVPRGQSAD